MRHARPRARVAGIRALGVLLVLGLATTAARAAEPLPPAADLLGWVRNLAAPAMEGRAAGTPGADRAAAYIASHFRRIGLRPAGDGGDYLQGFDVLTRVVIGAPNTLEVVPSGAPARALVAGADFLPFSFSEDGRLDAEIVFAGYGISAPPLGYDDYVGADVRGKVVLVMTGEPRERDPQSPFRPPEHFHYTELQHKVINAREHGAAAIVVVEHPGRERDEPRPLRGTPPPWGILALSATREVARALLAPAGLDLVRLQSEIDGALAPRTQAVPGVRARLVVSLIRERGRTANVVGLLPGTDPTLRDEAVVIGAHYDHLGRGSPFSLAPEHAEQVHPGADDNASGTAAVLGLAESLARAGGTRRSLVFAAFSGEEVGLLGSTHYVRQPPLPLERTVAMVNFDMVGRVEERKLHVMGVDSGEGLRTLVADAAQGLDVTLALRGDGVGPSDHTAFYGHDIPVVYFFSGTHADYHRPSDTPDKINADGMRTVLALAYRTVWALATRDTRLAFARVSAAPAPRAGGAGYGPYFGSVPDFAESPTPGVRLSDVRAGGPAERAGLRKGDVIVRFAGITVRTLDDLVFALRGRRPGDTVEVVFVREGVEHAVDATLEQRR